MARQQTVSPRLRYWFDNTMSRGTPALIGWLSAISLAIVIPTSALLVWADVHTPTTVHNQLLQIWRTVGSTFKLGGAVGTPAFVLLSVLLALVGLFFASTLVGLIAAGVNRKIMDLRRGRSVVLEEEHTVLLGWSEQIFPIVSELIEANSNQRRSTVAILAEKDKIAMEDEIHARVGRTGSTRVICRTGTPTDPSDIDRVSPHSARSVIVLTPGGEDGDAEIVKTLLALTRSPRTRTRERPHHFVAAVQDGRNREAARLAAGSGACVLSVDDTAARLIVQTCRQPGLSLVYMDLLNYAGDEFYMLTEPALVGRTFGDALLAYDTSSVIGLLRADGSLALNPPSAAPVREGDRIIAISRDDDTVVVSGRDHPVDEAAIVEPKAREQQPERILMLGWNRRATAVITQLYDYVADGSVLVVVAGDSAMYEQAEAPGTSAERLKVSFQEGDVTERELLRSLDIGAYDHIVVLSEDDEESGRKADSRTLVTLLHLRDMETAVGRDLPVVAELTDDRNRALAPVSEDNDFIVSGKLISLLMTQVAENRELARVFDDLFRADGSEIHLKPAEDYVVLDREIAFYTVVESARRQGHAAIGFRRQSGESGTRLNPDKQQRLTLSAGDSVIVLAAS
ncbi:CASTOR/POLLUX-related putative ion channel [Streptomyces sp. NBC_01465]|uniref:CASTOR/POLLUX-related putative ion channel n=1 Tax=Streptomyces sp. NBC_01465 TaxID=2903878 RepID=UPI002E340FE1|nr:NAD-binding lipoprotein [Streptomyces sp. NBC_01465]